MPVRPSLPTLALAGALLAPAPGVHAAMMADCAPEIGRFCSDVAQGRGRIAACLASRRAELGPACQPSVDAMARRRALPAEASRVLSPSFQADLPAACAPDAARLCPGVRSGDGRVFACLYARSERVELACSKAARDAVRR